MRITHCCLSNFYIDNYNYQENALPRQNKLDGHDVSIIASTETYMDNKLVYVEPTEYVNRDGIFVKRIPYRKIPIHFIRRKIRSYQGVYELLEQAKPDVIMFHGISAWELKTVVKFKREYPDVKLYVDSHGDKHNSANNYFSKNILHKLFYKSVVKSSLPYIDKILYPSIEAGEFLNKIYDVPYDKMEFYPLGGTIIEERERSKKRKIIRDALNILDNDILIAHSGKLGKTKKTRDILDALAKVASERLHLVIVGSIPDEMKPILNPLIQADRRVKFVGWKTVDELMKYLCAADVYIQPGSQSATMQNAICCGCAMMIYPHKSHEPYLQGNGYYVRNVEDIKNIFKKLIDDRKVLKKMSDNSMRIARELLDYRKLAARLYE